MVRAPEEIKAKIDQLRKHKRGYQKTLAGQSWIVLMFLLVVPLLFAVVACVSYYTAVNVIFIFVVLLLPLLIYVPINLVQSARWKRAQYRELLAKHLEEALRILDQPDGEQIFLDTIDSLTVKSRTPIDDSVTSYEAHEIERMGPKVEAFSWVASPDLNLSSDR